MRIRVSADGATPEQVHDLTRAFIRTAEVREVPRQITDQPTVGIDGSAMRWTSPALHSEHAAALLDEYERLEMERQP